MRVAFFVTLDSSSSPSPMALLILIVLSATTVRGGSTRKLVLALRVKKPKILPA